MSEWKIRFGTAGTSDSFAAQGGKTSLDIPEYTAKMGLERLRSTSAATASGWGWTRRQDGGTGRP